MSDNVNNQYDFFKLINLDGEGNLGVNVVGGGGGSGDNYYVSGGTYNSNTEQLEFVGNDVVTTFNVDVSALVDTDTNYYVSGGTYNSNTEQLEFVGNDPLTTFNVDVSALVDTDTNYYTTGATYNSVTEELDFVGNDPLTTFSVDVSALVDTDTNYYVSGGTYNVGTEEIEFVGNDALTTFNVDVSALAGGSGDVVSSGTKYQKLVPNISGGYFKTFGKLQPFTSSPSISSPSSLYSYSVPLHPLSTVAITIPITLTVGEIIERVGFSLATNTDSNSTIQIALYDSKIVNVGGVDTVEPGNILIDFNTEAIDLTTAGFKSVSGYNFTVPPATVQNTYFIVLLTIREFNFNNITLFGGPLETDLIRMSGTSILANRGGKQSASGVTTLVDDLAFTGEYSLFSFPAILYSNT